MQTKLDIKGKGAHKVHCRAYSVLLTTKSTLLHKQNTLCGQWPS